MSKSNVVALDKDWWKKDRDSSEGSALAIRKKRALPKKLHPPKYFSERFGMGLDNIYDAIRMGHLYAWPTGNRRWGISEEDFEEFLQYLRKKRGVA